MGTSTLDPGLDETVTKADTEALKWLREFMVELNTQDNRATATPYYYELRYDYRDEENERHQGKVGYMQTIFFTEKAANQYIKDNSHNLPEGTYTFLAWGGRNPELKKLLNSIGKVVGIPYERK